MTFARCIYSYFSIFASLTTLPVHAYACVLEKLKYLKPLEHDSWGHRSWKSGGTCQRCWAGCGRIAFVWLLVACFSSWRAGWNCRLLLECGKWRWWETQKILAVFEHHYRSMHGVSRLPDALVVCNPLGGPGEDGDSQNFWVQPFCCCGLGQTWCLVTWFPSLQSRTSAALFVSIGRWPGWSCWWAQSAAVRDELRNADARHWQAIPWLDLLNEKCFLTPNTYPGLIPASSSSPVPNARRGVVKLALLSLCASPQRWWGWGLLGCPCLHLPAPGQPPTKRHILRPGQPCDWCTWPRTSLLPTQETGGLGR